MHRGRGPDDGRRKTTQPMPTAKVGTKGMIEMRILREWSTTRSITALVLAATGFVAIMQAARMIGTSISNPGSKVQDGLAPPSTRVGPTGYRGKHRQPKLRRRPKPNQGGGGVAPVVGVSATRAGGQALQQGRDLAVAGGVALVVLQPPLGALPAVLGHQRRDGNLQPVGAGPVGDRVGPGGWRAWPAGRCGCSPAGRRCAWSCRSRPGPRRRDCAACPRPRCGLFVSV
jgi:hypothetical protein